MRSIGGQSVNAARIAAAPCIVHMQIRDIAVVEKGLNQHLDRRPVDNVGFDDQIICVIRPH